MMGTAAPALIDVFVARYYHVAFMVLVAVGLYILIDSKNLVKKVIGLNIFQMSVFLFFITASYREGAGPALVEEGAGPYVNPLPHVLILTAIVVGVSLTSLALALVVRVYEEYGTLNEDRVEEVMSNE